MKKMSDDGRDETSEVFTKVTRIHPLKTINLCIRLNGNQSNSFHLQNQETQEANSKGHPSGSQNATYTSSSEEY